jgi:hypothetical protein
MSLHFLWLTAPFVHTYSVIFPYGVELALATRLRPVYVLDSIRTGMLSMADIALIPCNPRDNGDELETQSNRDRRFSRFVLIPLFARPGLGMLHDFPSPAPQRVFLVRTRT